MIGNIIKNESFSSENRVALGFISVIIILAISEPMKVHSIIVRVPGQDIVNLLLYQRETSINSLS
jgi:hypothetical protein